MRRAVLATVGAAAFWLLSCREIPSPEEGVLSISPLLLPSPGLVVGDTMRDSLGLVAPLRVIAYDADGNQVPGVPATFVVLDTGAHVVGALLIGDDTVATGVVGAAAGLQTESVRVPVTLMPQQILASDSIRHQLRPGIADQEATSDELRTRIVHGQGATLRGIEGIVVRYEIVRAPQPTGGSTDPTAILIPGNTNRTRDTTDGNGAAGRRVRFDLLISGPTDSAMINATASYRGQTLGTVQFIVVFTK
jgi:hypothetical protein